MRYFYLAFVLALLASPVGSGAWLREKGTGFSSTTASLNMTRDVIENSYFEFGVRDDLTLGAEIGLSATASGTRSGFATLFLRRPIGRTDRPNRWAYELGLGANWDDHVVSPHLKTGISWGRGYSLKHANGWMTVDTSVTWDIYFAEHQTKVDGTLGLNFNNRFAGMFQVFHVQGGGQKKTTLAPSVVFSPLKSRPKVKLQIGFETQLGNSANPTFKVSFWREF